MIIEFPRQTYFDVHDHRVHYDQQVFNALQDVQHDVDVGSFRELKELEARDRPHFARRMHSLFAKANLAAVQQHRQC